MRIVIDLQGAQGESRHRGIGRYSLELALAMARNRGTHEILIALNDLCPEAIADLRAAFHDLLPPEAIRIWSAPGPVMWLDPANERRRKDAELIREAFFASLDPDVVLVASLIEGTSVDIATSIGRLTRLPTAVVLYDLIPLLYPEIYLSHNERLRAWYFEKLDHLRRADHLLSISQSAAEEALTAFDWDPQRVTNISTAASSHFQRLALSSEDRAAIASRYGLTRPYLMYTGGIDPRKNIEGLISAFARLPPRVRNKHQLAIVCNVRDVDRDRLNQLAASVGLAGSDMVLTGFVPDEDLLLLYNACKAFVFPSIHEGFGLPALEAMQCGRAVIGSNTSSIPEVIGRTDALFDPRDEASITARIEQTLTDDAYRENLEAHGLVQARNFSWDMTAIRALKTLESAFATKGSAQERGDVEARLDEVVDLLTRVVNERADVERRLRESLQTHGNSVDAKAKLGQRLTEVSHTLAVLVGEKAGQRQALGEMVAEVRLSTGQTDYLLHRSIWECLLFRRSGRPKKPVQMLLFHRNGKPRNIFRGWVLRRDGRPRKLFRKWMSSPAYQRLPGAQYSPELGPAAPVHGTGA